MDLLSAYDRRHKLFGMVHRVWLTSGCGDDVGVASRMRLADNVREVA